jgi:hypothetical protein
MDLTKRIKARIDDSHAPPGDRLKFKVKYKYIQILKNKSLLVKVKANEFRLSLVRCNALYRIKSYDPQLG